MRVIMTMPLLSVFVLLVLTGCSTPTKQIEVPVVEVTGTVLSSKKQFAKIKVAVADKKLRRADDLYLSLRGTYSESNEVADAILLLAKAHMDAGEYLLSKYYADSYIVDYPTGRRLDKAAFFRVKSVFLRFKSNPTDPTLQKQMKEDIEVFHTQFPKSKYLKKIKEMQKLFNETRKKKNLEIAKNYERMGKVKAAAYYRNKE